ncbi:TonB-dependent receptor [Rhodobacterales bacterium HKCCSP123]|nr:TonB-dependent receptor [Rhodobacterales bacterium HKCCSP123]
MKHIFTAALPLALLTPAMAPAQTALFSLDEIVFFGNATETELGRIGNSVSIVTDEELEEAGDLQLTEYLARLPGVTLTQNGPQGGTADIRIRGAQGRYVSVYVDGILVTDPSGTVIAYEDFGGLTTGSIRRIEVLRGSQSALYGGTAVGGVINISTLAGDDAPEGTSQTAALEVGSYNTYALSYGLTQRTGPLTLSLGLDHTRSDGFSAGEENAGNTEADGFDRTRLSFGAAYEVTDALTIGFNGFIENGSHEFDEGFSGFIFDGTPDERSERETVGLRAYLSYDAGGVAHEASVSAYRIERRSFSDTRDPMLSVFEGRRLAFDYSGTADLGPAMQLTFGANAMREEATYDNLPSGAQTVDTFGVFVEGVWSPNDDFDLTSTLRYDDHSGFGGQTTGRLAFAWRPDGGTVIRGAVGTGYRPPAVDELFGDYDDDDYPFFGNPNLQPEESISFELGIDREFTNGASLSATLFRLDIENLVAFDACPNIGAPNFECQPGTFSTLQNLPGTSRRQGIELSGRLPLSGAITLTGAYTYTDARNASGDRLLLVPEHDIALGIDAEWANGWSGNLTAQRVIGVLDSDFPVATPLPDYTLVNASLGYELSDGVEAYVRVHNLFNEEYQSRRGFGTSDRAVYLGLRARY